MGGPRRPGMRAAALTAALAALNLAAAAADPAAAARLAALPALSWADLETRTVPLLTLGLGALAAAVGGSWTGAALGFGIVGAVWAAANRTRPGALGFGDVLLFGLVGLALGPHGLLFTAFAMAAVNLTTLGPLILAGRMKASDAVAVAPFLAAAALPYPILFPGGG